MSTRNGLDMGSPGQLAPYGEHSSAQTVPALHWTRPQDSRDPLASLTRPVSLGTVRADVLKYMCNRTDVDGRISVTNSK